MILYPTETIYGIGVNPFDVHAVEELYALKGRDVEKAVSWLVRTVEDIERYAELSPLARRIATAFLPGPLTLVLQLRPNILSQLPYHQETIGFRVSTDVATQSLIERHFAQYDAPLTCTSANVSGLPTLATPQLIIEQFLENRNDNVPFSEIIDDGPRMNPASTVVSIIDDEVTLLREGAVPFVAIKAYL